MADLVERTPEAAAWLAHTLEAQEARAAFGRFRPAVIWTDATRANGEPLLALDPVALAAHINADPYPLQVEHDPGRPMGAMVAAEAFTSPAGERFVAAVLGFYDGAPRIAFRDLDFDVAAPVSPPLRLPTLPADFGVTLAVDPREVTVHWLEDALQGASFPVEFDRRSYNAADTPHQLVSVVLAFALLVWNPFSKAFIEAAGKAGYAAAHSWIRRLLERVGRLQNPIVELKSWQEGCAVSFMIRGRDAAQNYKAHDAVAEASRRSAKLIAHMVAADLAPVRLVYEFDAGSGVWFPSFAELADGRLMTDNAELIAAEHVPMGLSLGVSLKSLEGLPDAFAK